MVLKGFRNHTLVVFNNYGIIQKQFDDFLESLGKIITLKYLINFRGEQTFGEKKDDVS